MTEFTIAFSPSGKRGRIAEGTSVLEAARKLGVDLDSVCGGRGICGRCRIAVVEGVDQKRGIASAQDHVTARGAVEERYGRLRGGFAPGERLGCQARIRGDLLIDVPAESQLHRQVVRKRAEAYPVKVDPVVRLHYVEVARPDMADPSSDFRRLAKALEQQWGLADVRADLSVLHGLQKTLRAGEFAVTAAIRHGHDIVAVYPGFKERILGLAFDIGSTTVAAHLCDLASGDVLASGGRMNPQIRLGEDLMSRVSYIMMHEGGDRELTQLIHEALAGLAAEVAGEAGAALADIVEVTLAGNPIMHHLALGLDPTELGVAPFALTIDAGFDAPAREIGLAVAPGAYVHALPCIGGHVGADAAAVVLCEGPYLSDDIRLIVDVGTNAEIVLGNRSRLLACSSPTGPAFEGAQISCGQRAAPGAIERLRIDRVTLEPRFKVIGCDQWSDEEGFAEAIGPTGVTGICGSGIIETVAEMAVAGLLRADGIIDGAMASRTPRILADGRTFTYLIAGGEPRIAVTQGDIRAIQLAKAALYAGVKLLMDRYGVAKVERITLAGAFGSHIDPVYAMALGLIPDCPLDKVSSAGNAAGTGARIALLNAASRREIGEVVQRIEKVETAIEPAFQAHFVEAMAIPHAVDAFPNLEARLGISFKRAAAAEPRRRGGRRRG
ncbi:MAG: ASKHA domain-containing protein [Hyphomicrobiales bacterium]